MTCSEKVHVCSGSRKLLTASQTGKHTEGGNKSNNKPGSRHPQPNASAQVCLEAWQHSKRTCFKSPTPLPGTPRSVRSRSSCPARTRKVCLEEAFGHGSVYRDPKCSCLVQCLSKCHKLILLVADHTSFSRLLPTHQ